MIKVDMAQERVADIYLRFEEHIKLYDAPVRNDKQIWQWVDEMDEQTLSDILTFAAGNKFFNHEVRDWLLEVAERSPFYMRSPTERHKTSQNNTNIWKMLMLMRESIEHRLKSAEDPKNRLFERL